MTFWKRKNDGLALCPRKNCNSCQISNCLFCASVVTSNHRLEFPFRPVQVRMGLFYFFGAVRVLMYARM